jgi:hypothetical protein
MRCILSSRRVSDIGGTGTDAGFISESYSHHQNKTSRMNITKERSRLVIEGSEAELAKAHTCIVALMVLSAAPEHLYPQAMQQHLDGVAMWIESDPSVLKQKIEGWRAYKNFPATPAHSCPLESKS